MKNTKTSIYMCVSFDKSVGKWISITSYDKKRYHLGRFEKEEDAAEAYNKKAEELMGNKGYRNEIGVGYYMIGGGNFRKRWTKEEDLIIEQAYDNKLDIKETAKELGRGYQSVISRASIMGYSKTKTHRLSGKRPHNIWKAVKTRVNNKNGKSYNRYGGRGITLCDEWQSFEGFWEDMEEGYSDSLTIGRIDNDKGYYKGNCRWETREQQDNNTSRTRWITYKGRTQSLMQWANEIGMQFKTLDGRLERGWSVEHALTIPVGTTSRYRDKVLNK